MNNKKQKLLRGRKNIYRGWNPVPVLGPNQSRPIWISGTYGTGDSPHSWMIQWTYSSCYLLGSATGLRPKNPEGEKRLMPSAVCTVLLRNIQKVNVPWRHLACKSVLHKARESRRPNLWGLAGLNPKAESLSPTQQVPHPSAAHCQHGKGNFTIWRASRTTVSPRQQISEWHSLRWGCLINT